MNPSDYSTRSEVLVSGPTPEQMAAEVEQQAQAMRASDGKVRYALLETCVKQGIYDDDLAISIAFPGVDHFYVDELGNIQSSGTYASLAEYVTLRHLETKTKLNPATPPHMTNEQKERTFEVTRDTTIAELHRQLSYYATNGDQKNYRRVRAEISAL